MVFGWFHGCWFLVFCDTKGIQCLFKVANTATLVPQILRDFPTTMLVCQRAPAGCPCRMLPRFPCRSFSLGGGALLVRKQRTMKPAIFGLLLRDKPFPCLLLWVYCVAFRKLPPLSGRSYKLRSLCLGLQSGPSEGPFG